ncbi:MAG: multidrug effflux MFS transporter [Rhodocyclaceae bacterium]|jgi:DHA1 family bicyclomycin/chloramphenicol resistance-like MFS transporter|nr:multidrug effflux MFS transporter [Rhodocyclaceae bacterium]
MSPTTLLWLIAGSLMLQPLSTDLYLASLPHLATGFGVSPAAAQQTLSLFVIGFGVAQLASGPLSDRFGRRPVLLWGLALYIAASLACAAAPTLGWLIAARFVQAAGCCTAVVVARALVRDAFAPAEGARVLAKASSLLALAPLIGPVLGGYLQVGFGWRAAFVFHTLFAIALLAATARLFRETLTYPDPEATRIGRLYTTYCRIASADFFWAWALPGALSYAAIFAFISGSSFVLIDVLGVPTHLYGYCFAFGVSGYLIGTIACRRLLARLGLPGAMRVGVSISLFSGLLFAALVLAGVHHWSVVLLCQFLTMGAHGINFPCAQAGAVAPFPREAGAAAGLLGFFTMVAALVTGTWVGISHDGTIRPLALTSATLGVLLFASAWMLRRQRQANV